MTSLFKPLTWPFRWIANRGRESTGPSCASACPRPSLWYRLRHRPAGTLLQGVFYCRPQCLETALVGQLSRLRGMPPSPQPPNRIPLGLLMVARGKLTHIEVRAALEAQRRAHYGKIGDWIEKLGFATEQEVTTALALQWGCPVASSFDPAAIQFQSSIPLPILESFCMLPVNYAATTNTLYIAFGERVDHGALYAIERILDCRTQPCVTGRKIVARKLEAMRQLPRPSDVEFGPINDLTEMARIAASYTARLTPEQVRLSRIGRFIWLRLDLHRDARAEFRINPGFVAGANVTSDARYRTRPSILNLVFRLPSEPPRMIPYAQSQRIPVPPPVK